jgi:hypothetical protein
VTTDVLEQAGLGIIVHPSDMSGIKHALYELHRQWRQGRSKLIPHEAFIRTFERAQLTQRLATLFDTVAVRREVPAAAESQPSSRRTQHR